MSVGDNIKIASWGGTLHEIEPSGDLPFAQGYYQMSYSEPISNFIALKVFSTGNYVCNGYYWDNESRGNRYDPVKGITYNPESGKILVNIFLTWDSGGAMVERNYVVIMSPDEPAYPDPDNGGVPVPEDPSEPIVEEPVSEAP